MTKKNPQQKSIFISYNSKERENVLKIAQWLKDQGLNPWVDEWNIQSGTSIHDSLEKALMASATIVLCIGKNGTGPWHREEVKIAIRQSIYCDKTIIPLYLPGCPVNPHLSLFLDDTLAVDFRQGFHDEKACEKLLRALTSSHPDQADSPLAPAGDLYDLPVMQDYARALVQRYQNIDTLGIPDLRDKRAIPLDTIFIDLDCTDYPYPLENEKITPVNDSLDAREKLIILGDPGSGKSTLLKYQTLTRARFLAASKKGPVPIIIVLRNYTNWRTEPGREKVSFLDYYYWHCRADLVPGLPDNFFETLLEQGRCHIFFDGYDELATGVVKQDNRKAVENFSIVQYPHNRIVITSRTAGYERHPFDGKVFTHVKLTPFSPRAMEEFVRKWYAWKSTEQGKSDRERDNQITDLIKSLKNKQIVRLAENPLLLTMIAIIHRNEAILPRERFQLYEKITEALLATWDQYKGLIKPDYYFDRLRIRLAHIAHWMHTLSEGNDNRQTEVKKQAIKTELTAILMRIEPSYFKDDKPKAKKEAGDFLTFISERAGLLVDSGDGLYCFVHLSFQEYFTALYWFEQELDKKQIWEELYKPLIPNSHYQEVLLLLFSMMVHGGRKKSAEQVLRQSREWFWTLIEVDPEKRKSMMINYNWRNEVKQLVEIYEKKDYEFLVFIRSALDDCLCIDIKERRKIEQAFYMLERYYLFLWIQIVQYIYSIQKKAENFNQSRAYILNIDNDFALYFFKILELFKIFNFSKTYDLVRGLDRDFTLVLDLSLTLDFDLILDRCISRINEFSNALMLAFSNAIGFTPDRISTIQYDLIYLSKLNINIKLLSNSPNKFTSNVSLLMKNCQNILNDISTYIEADHSRYILFSSITLLHMGFILHFRWRFLEENMGWNYPDLDHFVDTAGGLLDSAI